MSASEQQDRDNTPMLSVVIPVYNESENLHLLYNRLCPVLEQCRTTSEILFVNDGSTDDSADIIRQLHIHNPQVKLLSFSRNFGHQIAITAGLDHCTGDAVIVMDGDLQHPPELIPQLLEQWRNGYNVVYTIRQGTADAGLSKRLTSRWFYRLLRALSGMPILEGSADFRLMDRQALRAFKRLREQNRFIRGLVPWIGFRQVGIPYVAAERHAGHSKYTALKMLRFALDGISSFSYIPLRLSFYIGLVVSLLGFLYTLYALITFAVGRAVPGWTSLLVVVLVLGGIQMIMLGIVGEYLGRIYTEVKHRPLYILREALGFCSTQLYDSSERG